MATPRTQSVLNTQPGLQDPQQQQPIAFKVMRLTRPSFHLGFAAASRVRGDEMDEMDEYGDVEIKREDKGISESLSLPAGFGSIYLGETFSGYVSVINHSSVDLSQVTIKAELQTGTKRSVLLDNSQKPLEIFAAQSNFDFLVEQEMNEICVHIMICTATFHENSEEKKIRQYFKFQVLKPVSVNTKIHMMLESVYLENQIQNISQNALYLESVNFDATNKYQLTNLNNLRPPSEPKPDTPLALISEVYGEVTFLRPGDIRQFLYKLEPKSGRLDPHDKESALLGKLEMRWKGCLGEPGRLHTYVDMVQWKLPPKREIELSVASLPDKINLEDPFEVIWRVKNCTERPAVLQLSMPTEHDRAVVACGPCSQVLPVLAPGQSLTASAHLIALLPGVQTITASVVDTETDKTHHLSAPIQILVNRD